MIVAVALVVLVVVAVAISVATGDRSGDGFAHVIVVLTVLVIGGVVVLALGAGIGTHDRSASPVDEVAPSVTVAEDGSTPLRPPELVLVATAEGQLPQPLSAKGDLGDGEVLVVGVVGLEAASPATVHQCPTGATRPSGCRAGLAFQVGPQGAASVLVDLEARFEVVGVGEVDCTRRDCSVVVFGTSRLEAMTVFGRPAPPPVTVGADPAAVPPGGTVTVAAAELPSGSAVAFAVCRPDGDASADCGAPTPEVRPDASGRRSASLTVSPGRCPRGATCAVAVIVDGGEPRAYAFLRIIGRPGAAYDDPRLRAGLVVAALLFGAALVLLRRTDWTPIGGDPFAGVTVPDDPFADVPDP